MTNQLELLHHNAIEVEVVLEGDLVFGSVHDLNVNLSTHHAGICGGFLRPDGIHPRCTFLDVREIRASYEVEELR